MIVSALHVQVAAVWRGVAGIRYLVLSYLWYLSLRRNDPTVSDPFGAAGYTASICLGLVFAAFVPIPMAGALYLDSSRFNGKGVIVR